MYPFCSPYCFVFLIPDIFTCVKMKKQTHMKKKFPLPSDLQLRIVVKTWGVLYGFFFFSRKGAESERHRKHQIFFMLIITVYVLSKHFKHSTPGTEGKIQFYQCFTCWCQNLELFSPYFSFPSHNQTQFAFFFLSRGYYPYLKNCIS